MQRSPLGWAAELVGVAVAYFAAARLGLPRTTLISKMQRLGINR